MPTVRILLAVLSFVISGVRFSQAIDVVCVCPSEFRAEIKPWVNHRIGNGLRVRVIDADRDGVAMAESIRRASDADTRYVVLVGDAPVLGQVCDVRRMVPVLYSPTKVTKNWGSTPTLASDFGYGDFDQDGVPDAAVGRLPVDTAEQLEQLVERIIKHESSTHFGPWRSRVQVVGGIGGFSPLIDRSIESVARSIVTSVLPTETRTSITYASPGHPFCPQQQFTDAVVARYAEGSRFWVYAGHGRVTELDRVPPTVEGVPVLDRHSVQRLENPNGSASIALLLACYCGAVDASKDSIAEELLLCKGGPVAVVAGSRVTMPYGNSTLAVGLINAIYQKAVPRFGDAWRCALLDMHQESPVTGPAGDDSPVHAQTAIGTRTLIDALATIVSPAGTQLVDERREHMLLYSLLGDPTLKLNHPQPVQVSLATGYNAGEDVLAEVRSPVAGKLTLSLDQPLGAVTEGDPNAITLSESSETVAAGNVLTMNLRVPRGYSGPLIVRAIVAGQGSWGAGAARTNIRR